MTVMGVVAGRCRTSYAVLAAVVLLSVLEAPEILALLFWYTGRHRISKACWLVVSGTLTMFVVVSVVGLI